MQWRGNSPHPVRHFMCNINSADKFPHMFFNAQLQRRSSLIQAAAPCGVPLVRSTARGAGEIDADAVVSQASAVVGGTTVIITGAANVIPTGTITINHFILGTIALTILASIAAVVTAPPAITVRIVVGAIAGIVIVSAPPPDTTIVIA